jgi:hypothetical protein
MILNQRQAQQAWSNIQAALDRGAQQVATTVYTHIGRVDVSTFVRETDPEGAPPIVLVMYDYVSTPFDTPTPEIYTTRANFKAVHGIR